MQEFIAIDFETANPKRVSACALGYAKVSNYRVVKKKSYLIKPVGGHAPFQSRIHGIKEKDTCNKPEFGELFFQIQEIFNYPLVAHSLFDKQVLNALIHYFNLELKFDYIDSVSVAKECLPNLNNYKLKTLVKHFGLPQFKHHDPKEDAIACAKVFLKLKENLKKEVMPSLEYGIAELKGMVLGILADDEVNYKEAYELLYWFEDNIEIRNKFKNVYTKTRKFLEDDYLDRFEAEEMKVLLRKLLNVL